MSGLVVLSLFDGIGTGRLALERASIPVKKYYASEIDKHASKVANRHFDIINLGDVTKFNEWEIDEPHIDLIIGGSPCQDVSRMKTTCDTSPQTAKIYGDKSRLFFDYAAVVKKYKPKYFFLENVVMDEASVEIVTEELGVDPVIVNSNVFTAQDRPRMYWTNIPIGDIPEEPSEEVLEDILEPLSQVDEKHYIDVPFEEGPDMSKKVVGVLERFKEDGKRRYMDISARVYNPKDKMATLTAVSGGGQHKKVYQDGQVRRLTPLEYERLQGMPDNYTVMISDSQRYKALGNGWTLDVIVWFFGHLKGGDE